MTATATTAPMAIPAIAPPLIEFGFTGTAVAELLAARPVPEVEVDSPIVDVVAVDVVDGSPKGVGCATEELVVVRTVLL